MRLRHFIPAILAATLAGCVGLPTTEPGAKSLLPSSAADTGQGTKGADSTPSGGLPLSVLSVANAEVTDATVSATIYATQEFSLTFASQKVSSDSAPVDADLLTFYRPADGDSTGLLYSMSAKQNATYTTFAPSSWDLSRISATLKTTSLENIAAVRSLELRERRTASDQLPGKILVMFPYTRGAAYGSDATVSVSLDESYCFTQFLNYDYSLKYVFTQTRDYQARMVFLSDATFSVLVTDSTGAPISGLTKANFYADGTYVLGGVTDKGQGNYDLTALVSMSNPGDKRWFHIGIKNAEGERIVTMP